MQGTYLHTVNILQRAGQFVQSFLQPPEARRCQHRGSNHTKKHGAYWRIVRGLDGTRQVKVPRYRRHGCRKTYSVPDRRWALQARYGREVQRKALAPYFRLGASWRQWRSGCEGRL